MLTRIITASIATMLFIPICIFSGTIVFPVAIGILCAVAVYEMAKCLGFDKNYVIVVPMYIVALALPMLRHEKYAVLFNTNNPYLAFTMVLIFGLLIYTLAYVMFKKNTVELSKILTFFAMYVYIVGCFTSMVIIRYTYANLSADGTAVSGKYVYLLAFLGAWICDTFAYFVGKFFGKHKLIPEISPKKTIEGSIGGIVFTVGGFALYALSVNNIFHKDLSYLKLCILGLVLSIVSQIGDLIASSVKRQYAIKDYGSLFPGHGGVLDRFDSVMLTAPTLFILNTVINLF